MADVLVILPGPLMRLANGAHEVPAEGHDVAGVLASLAASQPRLTGRILDGTGEPRPFLRLYLNDQDISALDKLSTPVSDGDRLAILLAVAGG